jgi:CRP-like cAMP-binding protein
MPVLEELPPDEKMRRGYVILRSRPRSAEETLLELINDEDQVIAACAIDYVREIKEWRLKEDIEHVLAHRDARDWYVFESASWTLAAHRLGDARRQELWREPLPASELAARWRRLPLFASVWTDELFRLAGAGRQVRWEPGRTLMQEGSAPDAVHVLLEGEVIPRRGGTPRQPLKAPAALGLRETLEGRPARATIRAEHAVVTLALPPDEVRALVADNQDLLDGLLRTIVSGNLLGRQERTVVRGGAPLDLLASAADGVAAIEKVLILQRLPLFAAVSAEEMLHVAAVARDVSIEAGQELASEGQAPAIYYVLSGELLAEPAPHDPRDPGVPGKPSVAGPGDALGVFETLAGRPIGRRVQVTRGGIALKIDRRDLIDQLGQRPALGQQVFTSLFEMLEHGAVASA